jgi:hypothetical protein
MLGSGPAVRREHSVKAAGYRMYHRCITIASTASI